MSTTPNNLEHISSTKCFNGWIKRYQHKSVSVGTDMTFAIFLPPQAEHTQVPVLYWLSGLTCTDENFMQKSGAQRLASELGLAIVCPDTSPRGTDFPGEHDDYDFGSAAGFYLNATETPWSEHYRMYDYVVTELPALIQTQFPVNKLSSISGHSMGGHGAIICALKNPGLYQSVSAFAPISNPINCPWGQKAFTGYLGKDQTLWQEWDSCELVLKATEKLPLLVSQGQADAFLDEQLKPEALAAACKKVDYPLELQLHAGYDHSYFFIASFIDDHLHYHAKALGLR